MTKIFLSVIIFNRGYFILNALNTGDYDNKNKTGDRRKMIKRNIAISALILIIIAVFSVAIIKILTAGAGSETAKKTGSTQPFMKISDVISEAVYMGSYSSDTEIYADEQFSAKDVLRSAIRRSESLPETVDVLIEGHNYNDLSVMFDDGNTMKLLEQPGTATVMIVASIPKLSGDVFYAYNVQIVVNESRSPDGTDAPSVTGVTVSRITRLPVTRAYWAWDDDEDETTAVSAKVTWAKVTTAAAAGSGTKTYVTAAATEAEPSQHPVTEAPAPSEPPSVEPSAAEPEPPSAEPSVADPEPPAPESPSEPDPPADPEPEPPAEQDAPAE